MIQLLTLLFLLSPLTAHPPTPSRTPETHTAVLHYIQRRNIGCYSGCQQSCNSCTSNYCSQSCNSCVQNCQPSCQNNCQICQQQSCQQNTQCGNCCTRYCPPTPCCTTTSSTTSATTTSTTTRRSDDTTTTSRTSTTSTVTPPTATPVNISNTVNVSNNVQTNIANYLKNENRIHVPVIINNVNKFVISNRVVGHTNIPPRPTTPSTTTKGDPIISTTPSTSTTTSSSCEEDDRRVIIITIPYQGYHIHPVIDLPCIQQGYSCNYQRSYWNGNVCGDWSGYGSHWGGGSGYWGGYQSLGLDWGGFSGCRTVNQNCGACGSNFYNRYSRSSWEYSSCYGCFI